MTRLWSTLRAAFFRGRLEHDMAAEMEFHLEARIEDLVRRGIPPPEARRQARLEFGASDRYKEECRESRGLRWLIELAADVRYTLRGLRQSPGFAAAVILSLALGIGANTAMFSIVNGVLLRPLPYRDPSRLIVIREELTPAQSGLKNFRARPYANALLERDRLTSFEDILASDFAVYQMVDVPEPEELSGSWVTWNLCGFLGVRPVAGRCFTAEEEASQAQVAMLSYGLWQRQFGGDPALIGRAIPLRGFDGLKRVTIIGILPPDFDLLRQTDVWMPLSESQNYRARNRNWQPSLIARLKPGVSVERARAELLALQRGMYPAEYAGAAGMDMVVMPLVNSIARTVQPGLTILLGVVAVVLLLTCVNVANLLLARGAARIREMAVRASLGAGRARIFRQLLTESITLALIGGVAGLLLAHWMLLGIKALDFKRLPRVAEIQLDWRVLAFTATTAVASGLLFGLLPALRLSRLDLADAMKSGGAGSIGAGRRQGLMNALLVFETALCAVAVMSAGLLANTFLRLRNVDPGFRSQGVLAATLNKTSQANFSAILQNIRALPGVEAAGFTNYPPPFNVTNIVDFRLPGSDVNQRANSRLASPGYFQALGIPVLRGREFADTDGANSPRVVLVSESLARHYWPNQDPLGQTLIFRKNSAAVIGIVRDARQNGVRQQPGDLIYLDYRQYDSPPSHILIRASAAPASLAAPLKRVIREIDPAQTFRSVATLDQLMSDDLSESRFYAAILSVWGLLALALTTVGAGGLVAYSVSRRTREIGLRVSFGASRMSLLRLFSSGALRLALAGLALGIPASFAVTRLTRTLLFGITPTDPATIATVAILLAGLSVIASAAAAYQGTTVDPSIVLRHE